MKCYRILARAGIAIGAIVLFCLLRIDIASAAKSFLVAELRTQVESPRLISSYVSKNSVRKLQIGSGGLDRPGWLNTDIEPRPGEGFLDASKPFPLPERSFKYVYSEEVFEHITYEQGMVMLNESFRVLEPGGTVRIATPNLLQFIALFQEHRTKDMERFIEQKIGWHQWPQTPDPECYILNLQLRGFGHQFVYTPKLMRSRLEAAGFKNIKEFAVGESDNPDLRNLESRATWAISEANAYETMVFEGVRPN